MKKILFIGNSYTYFNDMPWTIFSEKAREAGLCFEVTAVTRGGWYLSRYANPEDVQGRRLRKVVEGKTYDFIVLQDQSCNPVLDRQGFLEAVGDLKKLLGEKTKQFVLYATWGRKAGSPQLLEMQLTPEEMTEKLDEAYSEAGEKYSMTVAHVGRAFAAYAQLHPEEALHDPDLSHPSEKGSEIAAETILATIRNL